MIELVRSELEGPLGPISLIEKKGVMYKGGSSKWQERSLLKDEKSRKRFPKKLGKEVVRIIDAAKTNKKRIKNEGNSCSFI